MNVRSYIPKRLLLFLRQKKRNRSDQKSGFSFASKRIENLSFVNHVDLVQEIKKKENFEHKIHNIQLGINALNNLVIEPDEVFSFWTLVPQPKPSFGFKKSRNIVNGKLTEDFGGGLCQLSSILYHLALISGLEIIERYNHSVDLYAEEERFTPLGSDATVVYAYKDFRFKNKFKQAIYLKLFIQDDHLHVSFQTNEKLSPCEIEFQREGLTNGILVKTFRNKEVLTESFYLKPQ